jgi:hypothetical protein
MVNFGNFMIMDFVARIVMLCLAKEKSFAGPSGRAV